MPINWLYAFGRWCQINYFCSQGLEQITVQMTWHMSYRSQGTGSGCDRLHDICHRPRNSCYRPHAIGRILYAIGYMADVLHHTCHKPHDTCHKPHDTCHRLHQCTWCMSGYMIRAIGHMIWQFKFFAIIFCTYRVM